MNKGVLRVERLARAVAEVEMEAANALFRIRDTQADKDTSCTVSCLGEQEFVAGFDPTDGCNPAGYQR